MPTRLFLSQPSLEGKTVINTTSKGALLLTEGLSDYQTSKLAISKFTEFLDSEYGKQGLRTFSYHPGGVPTELALNMPEAMHQLLVDKPELAGGYTVWLSTPAADFLKGRFSSATWDVDELTTKKDEILKGNLLRTAFTGLTAGPAR
jgi:NAD(P)-dependent dehydrogenase (short-subunit alcohol dehydrogenase family)